MRCNYLPLPQIPVPGSQVHKHPTVMITTTHTTMLQYSAHCLETPYWIRNWSRLDLAMACCLTASYQTNTWTNANLLTIETFEMNCSKIWSKIHFQSAVFCQENAFEKCYVQIVSHCVWHQSVKQLLLSENTPSKLMKPHRSVQSYSDWH